MPEFLVELALTIEADAGRDEAIEIFMDEVANNPAKDFQFTVTPVVNDEPDFDASV